MSGGHWKCERSYVLCYTSHMTPYPILDWNVILKKEERI